jgi:ATP-dependent Clp protease protease subunit
MNISMIRNEKSEEEVTLSYMPVAIHGDHIWFYGDIDSQSSMLLNKGLHEVSMRMAPTMFSSMQEVGPAAPIFLHINSLGGDLFSAFSIADTVERISMITPIITVVEGCAASGATLISVAGTRKLIRKNAFMLIHELRAGTWGKYSELKDQMKSNDTIMKSIRDWYAEKTKIKPKDLELILTKDIWWNAKQCIRAGLVDQII